jgi:hypothetical protein
MENQGRLSISIVIRGAFLRKIGRQVAPRSNRIVPRVLPINAHNVGLNPAFPGTMRELAQDSSQKSFVVLRECILL